MSEKESNGTRLREIISVIHKHQIARGVTPEKLRLILEDLGPTYIKLGQIMSMRSDIFPKKICDEFMRLRSEVTPMPFSEVREVIEHAYGMKLEDVFEEIQETPIGSASIAQVHKAKLKSGETVVVKVQRKGIYETMSRDIAFLHRAVKLMPPINMAGLVDMNQVLDEMWVVAQDEMNFLAEAANMEEFARLNKNVAFVTSPMLYREYTTTQVLVMEYIDGIGVDEKEKLLEAGYDLDEIGSKMADNYVKQIMEDGFFHADPHPGNMRIRDGKIVWIDMGMMGRFSQRDQVLLGKVIKGVATNDVSLIVEAVLSLGDFHDKPDQKLLYSDIGDWLTKYGNANFGGLNMGTLMQDLMDIMKENRAVSNVISYNSGHYARERLKNILMADRIGCTPDVVTRIRDDMRKCVAAYVNIDSANMTVQLSDSFIIARIPVVGIHMKKDKEKDETHETDGHVNGKKIQSDQL